MYDAVYLAVLMIKYFEKTYAEVRGKKYVEKHNILKRWTTEMTSCVQIHPSYKYEEIFNLVMEYVDIYGIGFYLSLSCNHFKTT